MRADALIECVLASAYRFPTDTPESDGTLEWDATTMVFVEIAAGGKTGIGATYVHQSARNLINDKLAAALKGRDAFAIRACWHTMIRACRNIGRPGIVSCAISACDIALHDLVGKLLDISTARLLGPRRHAVPAYGSGGFTSYDDEHLKRQLCGWDKQGFQAVKMKVGREPDDDARRVRLARSVIGPETELMVDANGAYARKQALALGERFAEQDVRWYEEPVTSDDLEGLRLLRDRAPAGMEITAGEYGYDDFYFRRMLEAGAVDVIQADVTRALGYTGYLVADALAHAANIPLSSHCAPSLTLPCALAALSQRHMEWFHDHARIERMMFDGAPTPERGVLSPDWSRPGIGLSLKSADVEKYLV